MLVEQVLDICSVHGFLVVAMACNSSHLIDERVFFQNLETEKTALLADCWD